MSKEKREVLEFTDKVGREIIYGDHPDFEVVLNEPTSQDRWSTYYDVVVKRLSDGAFFASGYRKGSTEMQDELPFELDGKAEFSEVFPEVVQKVVYV